MQLGCTAKGFTPNMLMLGREVHQPQDIWQWVAEWKHGKEPPEYVHDLEKRSMRWLGSISSSEETEEDSRLTSSAAQL